MRKLLLGMCLMGASGAGAQIANHVVISEVYGGGGNSGSLYKNDFIELYNPTGTAVSLASYSVQYASATGSFSTSAAQITNLTGTIAPYSYYLIQQAAGTGGTANLPTPNATGSIAMSGSSGKVALVLTASPLTTAVCTGTPGQIIDLVSYGIAGCSEGAGPTPTLSNTTSAERKASATSTAATMTGSESAAGNGYDSDNNSADFVIRTTPDPQNSSSPTEGGVAGNTVSVAAGNTPAEPATDGSFTITLSSAAPAGGVTVPYTLTGTATGGGVDYTDAQSGTITIPQGTTTGTVNMTIADDVLNDPSETIIITLQTPNAGYTVSSATATLTIADNDAPVALLSAIQGSGTTATPGAATVEAIVTAVYPNLSPAGFYIQEEDADADTDPATSEGIFVVSSASVAVGNKVRVEGTVQESAASPSFTQAVITSATVTVLTASNPLPAPTPVSLPVSSLLDFEKVEGMLVSFPATLTVTNNFTLGRFGEVGLSAGGAVYQPTQLIDPNDNPASGTTSAGTSNVAAVTALAAANALRTILLDDATNNTTTLPYADPVDNTLRLGSTITGLTGIMGFAFDVYRIQPVPATPPVFTYAARPAVPSFGSGANVKVASFNVLNYFNGDGLGGGFPTARGAHSLAEFNRQRTKIISAITQINADVLGVIEMENDGTGANSAIQDLVNGLNAVQGAGTYSFINDGASIQTNGTDAIRCGIIYKSSVVTPAGAAMLSPSTTFNRPPLAQTFNVIATNVSFNFIINHFKSKSCTGSTGLNLDQGDGQACYNESRKQQSAELLNFISNTVIPASGSNLVLTVGDYNAYYEEDPLDLLRAAGYSVLSTPTAYSYQFNGQLGSLDHAVVSSAMNAYVTGIAKWNINSAEPVYLDYNDAINDGGGDFANPFAATYTPTAFRSSDHDPVLIGLNLAVPLPLQMTAFTAAREGSKALLQWTTADEKAMLGFTVERSADGNRWETVTTVEAGSPGGVYRAADVAPLPGENLYRIKATDIDGSNTYSQIRTLHFNAKQTMQIYPNPAADKLFVAFTNSGAAANTVQLLDVMNHVLQTGHPDTDGTLQLDLTTLAPGIYSVRIITAEGDLQTARFIRR